MFHASMRVASNKIASKRMLGSHMYDDDVMNLDTPQSAVEMNYNAPIAYWCEQNLLRKVKARVIDLRRKKRDVDLEVKSFDVFGLTGLHHAVVNNNMSLCEYLIKLGADVNQKARTDKCTPLHTAVQHKHLKLIKLLLKHGANPKKRNVEGETVFDYAEDSNTKVIQDMFFDPDPREENKSSTSSRLSVTRRRRSSSRNRKKRR